MEEVEVKTKSNIADLDGKKKPQKRLNHSNWFLTINTNKQFKDPDNPEMLAFVNKFYEVMGKIFEGNNVKKYIKIKEDGVKFTPDKFREIDVQYTVERGSNNGQIHAHVLVAVSHRTQITLDFTAIKEKVKEEMELPNIYFLSKLFRNASHNLEDYINKDVKEK